MKSLALLAAAAAATLPACMKASASSSPGLTPACAAQKASNLGLRQRTSTAGTGPKRRLQNALRWAGKWMACFVEDDLPDFDQYSHQVRNAPSRAAVALDTVHDTLIAKLEKLEIQDLPQLMSAFKKRGEHHGPISPGEHEPTWFNPEHPYLIKVKEAIQTIIGELRTAKEIWIKFRTKFKKLQDQKRATDIAELERELTNEMEQTLTFLAGIEQTSAALLEQKQKGFWLSLLDSVLISMLSPPKSDETGMQKVLAFSETVRQANQEYTQMQNIDRLCDLGKKIKQNNEKVRLDELKKVTEKLLAGRQQAEV